MAGRDKKQQLQQERDRRFYLGPHQKPVGAPLRRAHVLPFLFVPGSSRLPPRHEHRFLALHEGRRWLHATTQQAYMKHEPGSAWNVARCLLEEDGLLHVIGERFAVVCGFTECLNVAHWQPTEPPRFPEKTKRERHSISKIEPDPRGGGWYLLAGAALITTERVFVARVREAPGYHVIRALPTQHGSHMQFYTACGVAPDPARISITDMAADCEACLK